MDVFMILLASAEFPCVKLKYFLRGCDEIIARFVFKKEIFAKTLLLKLERS